MYGTPALSVLVLALKYRWGVGQFADAKVVDIQSRQTGAVEDDRHTRIAG